MKHVVNDERSRSREVKAKKEEALIPDTSDQASVEAGRLVSKAPAMGPGLRRLQSAQREELALKIGNVQGNLCLRAVLRTDPEPIARAKMRSAPTSVMRDGPGAPAGIASAVVPGLTESQATEAERNLTANPQSAVNTVANALSGTGKIDLSSIENRRLVYVSDASRMPPGDYGHTILTPGTAEPRPCRMLIGPAALGSVSTLYSTIMHEYQHVLQLRSGRSGEDAATEMEAYIWEVMHLEETGMWRNAYEMTMMPGRLRYWWDQLNDEEKVRYREKYDAAQATIIRMNERRLREQYERQTGRRSE